MSTYINSPAAPSSTPQLSAAALKPPIIDTHIHCFAGTKDERFPYHANAPYKPEDAATPEKLLEDVTRCGVNGLVIVHPEPYQDDHRYLEHCLVVVGNRFKGTALVFADQPKSVTQMPDLAKKLPIVAVRLHAYAPERRLTSRSCVSCGKWPAIWVSRCSCIWNHVMHRDSRR